MAERAPPARRPAAPDVPSSRGVWELAWPSMTSFAFQAVVGIVDMLFVSSLGTEVVAGVGIGSQLLFIAFALIAAIATGTVALVARATGAGDARAADAALRVSLGLAVGAGAALALAVPFTERLVTLFGVEAPVVAVGGSYLRILLWAGVPLAVGATFDAAVRGAGDMRTPLVVGLVLNAVNVVGDYVLIFGRFGFPELGPDGSALASAAAMGGGAIIYWGLWRSGRLVLAPGPALRDVSSALARRILRIGTPAALQEVAFNVGLFLFLRLVGEFGTEAVSAYLIGVRILAFSFIPGAGFATAAATLVGQHLGAGDPRAAARSGWRALGGALVVMSSVGTAIVLAAEPIAGWFGAGARTGELTVQFIRVLGAAQPLMAVEFALGGALRGAGDTRFPLVALLVGLFGFRLGLAATVMRAADADVVAVWSCLLADYLVKAVLLAIRFRRGRWQLVEV